MKRISLRSSIVALLILVSLILAVSIPTHGAAADGSLVIAALRTLEQEYYKSVDPIKLLNAAIESLRKATNMTVDALPDGLAEGEAIGKFLAAFSAAAKSGAMTEADLASKVAGEMLASLHDSHVSYLDPARYAEYKAALAGKAGYSGIGVIIGVRHGSDNSNWPFALDVIPGSPAEVAGIKRFDRFLEVDGASLKDVTIVKVIETFRGPAGSVVKLTVKRADETLTLAVSRAPIQVPSVVAEMIRPGVAYAKIFSFEQGTAAHFRKALQALATQGQLRSVILDLRGNPGGYLREAEGTAGAFLPADTVLARTLSRKEAPNVLIARGGVLLPRTPVIVLTDGGTTSSSEVVTMGLRNAHRATTVGEKTGGRLGASRDFPLPVGGMVVTTRQVVGPNYEQIEHVGITADIQVRLTGVDMEKGHDAQLEAALKTLGATLIRVFAIAA